MNVAALHRISQEPHWQIALGGVDGCRQWAVDELEAATANESELLLTLHRLSLRGRCVSYNRRAMLLERDYGNAAGYR